MRALVMLLLLAPHAAAERARQVPSDETVGYPADITILAPPERMWTRRPRGADKRPTLTWGFIKGRDCPSTTYARDPRSYPSCARFQAAVGEKLSSWAQAANIRVTRTQDDGPSDINIGWTSYRGRLPEPHVAGMALQNAFDFESRKPRTRDGSASSPGVGGFDKPEEPDGFIDYSTVLLNDDACWFLETPRECAAPKKEPFPRSSPLSLPRTALHELGHALGFGHFRESVGPAVMREGRRDQAGTGPEHAQLQAVDKRAARELYDRVSGY